MLQYCGKTLTVSSVCRFFSISFGVNVGWKGCRPLFENYFTVLSRGIQGGDDLGHEGHAFECAISIKG